MGMMPLLAALLQSESTDGERTSEETTPVIQEQVGSTLDETGDRLAGVKELFDGTISYLNSPQFFANIIATVIVISLSIIFYRVTIHLLPRILHWSRPDNEASLDAAALARIKRQDTAVTLIRNTLRYVVFSIVALFIFSIFVGTVIPAAAGVSIIAAVVGFGAQSFLRDIISGFFILFENQYSVGDFISVEPTKASGMVEEFGLRTTTIRSLSGEVIYIPNGSLIGVTNYVSGQQRFTIEVQLKDEEAAKRVLEEIQEGHDLYLIPPRLIDRDETPEGGPRLRLLAVVLPSTAWLVEENLVERIKAAASEDSLAADPLVYKVDSHNVRRLREFIPGE
ncbi:MAG TPA: mechanosensitive ion channel family protein [Rubrobacteraceae bacterium]|nr:mechanosensitive ion channel family protein [Rubrobacteraceae bacterium]